ncbi:PEP-CTERM sorting domain-containing protein [Methylomonas sp. LL1]|uniref:PEP-CTERM sorting domain-containing protein n=1 Tax=Methylomonas sp. LL1 TaxID=2785785 RepID=UPI0018C370C9|nr:PEP-CTERM sorting domain-containing protein [Methylomonas sp. LL1]QPK63483.1 PEP-CTERM sorting domain-containing protein [Methylomonas sp. LL1]
MKNRKLSILTLTVSCLITSAQAASIHVDGNLADWGLHRNGNINDWTPNPLLVPLSQYYVEDQTGNRNTRVFPGYGGQAYDAEALYTFIDNTHLYIALVTGLSPSTPNNPTGNSFGPGDFAIDFGHDGSFEFGIQTTGDNAGKVYRDIAWDYGLWDSNGEYIKDSKLAPDPSHPTSIISGTGTEVGVGDLIYSGISFTNMGQYVDDSHYVIEAAIPLLAFSGFSGKFDIHWTMNCANDAIWVDPIISNVPEPATFALLTLGLSGMAFSRHSNRRSVLA